MTDKRSDCSSSGEAQAAGAEEHGPGSAGATIGSAADLQSLLGRQLRAVYDDIARQPVPDRFIELMRQLDKASAG